MQGPFSMTQMEQFCDTGQVTGLTPVCVVAANVDDRWLTPSAGALRQMAAPLREQLEQPPEWSADDIKEFVAPQTLAHAVAEADALAQQVGGMADAGQQGAAYYAAQQGGAQPLPYSYPGAGGYTPHGVDRRGGDENVHQAHALGKRQSGGTVEGGSAGVQERHALAQQHMQQQIQQHVQQRQALASRQQQHQQGMQPGPQQPPSAPVMEHPQMSPPHEGQVPQTASHGEQSRVSAQQLQEEQQLLALRQMVLQQAALSARAPPQAQQLQQNQHGALQHPDARRPLQHQQFQQQPPSNQPHDMSHFQQHQRQYNQQRPPAQPQSQTQHSYGPAVRAPTKARFYPNGKPDAEQETSSAGSARMQQLQPPGEMSGSGQGHMYPTPMHPGTQVQSHAGMQPVPYDAHAMRPHAGYSQTHDPQRAAPGAVHAQAGSYAGAQVGMPGRPVGDWPPNVPGAHGAGWQRRVSDEQGTSPASVQRSSALNTGAASALTSARSGSHGSSPPVVSAAELAGGESGLAELRRAMQGALHSFGGQQAAGQAQSDQHTYLALQQQRQHMMNQQQQLQQPQGHQQEQQPPPELQEQMRQLQHRMQQQQLHRPQQQEQQQPSPAEHPPQHAESSKGQLRAPVKLSFNPNAAAFAPRGAAASQGQAPEGASYHTQAGGSGADDAIVDLLMQAAHQAGPYSAEQQELIQRCRTAV